MGSKIQRLERVALPQIFEENQILMYQTNTGPIFNARLAELILVDVKNRTKDQKENFTYWKKENLFSRHIQEFQFLRSVISQSVKQFTLEFNDQYRGQRPNFITSWANILLHFDGRVAPHRHDTNCFSIAGVYYAWGDFTYEMGGTKFWLNHRGKTISTEIKPSSGDLILFPGTAYHAISSYRSTIPRITFGFDVRFKKSDFYSFPCCKLESEVAEGFYGPPGHP